MKAKRVIAHQVDAVVIKHIFDWCLKISHFHTNWVHMDGIDGGSHFYIVNGDFFDERINKPEWAEHQISNASNQAKASIEELKKQLKTILQSL